MLKISTKAPEGHPRVAASLMTLSALACDGILSSLGSSPPFTHAKSLLQDATEQTFTAVSVCQTFPDCLHLSL